MFTYREESKQGTSWLRTAKYTCNLKLISHLIPLITEQPWFLTWWESSFECKWASWGGSSVAVGFQSR